jgi:glycosyltransferase involved in cell wall biosynthesis
LTNVIVFVERARDLWAFCGLRTANMDGNPFVSVIIPVHNAGQHLEQCLRTISTASYTFYEVIVVDDGSKDDSAEIARKNGAKVLKLSSQLGPAAARNYGSREAKGDILFFVDSDVLIAQETIARVAANIDQNPEIAAVFGSYDDSPTAKNFISQYKNLQHHFVHQHSSRDAVTFWAGCGAIRRKVFHELGGFDQNRYPKSSIEDIELGYRMKRAGHRILLDKDLQVKHLKQWKFGSLLRADIFHRAVPWSKLILETQDMISDLNVQKSDKISAGLVGLSVIILPFTLFKPQLLYLVLVFLAGIFILNYRFYRFLSERKRLGFVILTFPMHLLYYFYSGITFVLCWALLSIFQKKKPL